MMEAFYLPFAVLGAGAYLHAALYPVEPDKVKYTPEEEFERAMERPRDFVVHEARERGFVAPQFNASSKAGRVPWSQSNPPYHIYKAGSAGNTDSPCESAAQLYANALEHERLDVQEELFAGRQHYSRKRAQPIYSAFTRELTIPNSDPYAPVRTTNIAGFMWMPPTPTDEDINEAAALGKMLPPDPLLFTPDAYYFTAPGQNFRYGAGQTN